MNTSGILNSDSLSHTLLPFYDALTATRFFFIFFILIILCSALRAVVFRRSMTLHRAPTAVVFSYIGASLANMLLCSVFYWYWALPLCIIITAVFAYSASTDVKEANNEERMGIWGLNKDIRRIRGELFNDMTVEEQLKYRQSVKEYKFHVLPFFAVTLLAAALFAAVCKLSGLGYLLFPVAVQ